MKKILTLLLVTIFISCSRSSVEIGVSSNKNLPDEIKNFKVYRVLLDNGEYVKLGIIDGQINSVTNKSTTIFVNNNYNKLINVKEVIYQNDSIIVFKK